MITYINIVHRVAVFHACEPVLGLVLRLDNAPINEVEKVGLGVAIVLAKSAEELVGLPKVKDIEGSPGLLGTDVESTLSLTEECDQIIEVELRRNVHPNASSTICGGMVDGSLSWCPLATKTNTTDVEIATYKHSYMYRTRRCWQSRRVRMAARGA